MSLVTLKPRLSEKAYGISQTRPTYVIQVPADANKQTIAEAVAEQFKVTVVKVNVVLAKGKTKRTYTSRRGRANIGTRSDVKKAYITLKDGDSIPIFAADEQAEEKQEKQEKQLKKLVEKAEKKADKKAKKEEK